jgi:hypothetical protein
MDERWGIASNLLELGELTAQWIEGSIEGDSPWYGGEVDHETSDIGEVICALNRAGFVTTHSQPAGVPDSGWEWAQGAAVSGFASEEVARRIEGTLCRSDLITVRLGPLEESSCTIPITIWGEGRADLNEQLGEPPPISPVYTWEVGSEGHWEFERLAECLNETMIQSLTEAVRVIAIDPPWGRSDLLWSMLRSTVSE